MKSSTYYFDVKNNIFADFQICVSVPLKVKIIAQIKIHLRLRNYLEEAPSFFEIHSGIVNIFKGFFDGSFTFRKTNYAKVIKL